MQKTKFEKKTEKTKGDPWKNRKKPKGDPWKIKNFRFFSYW